MINLDLTNDLEVFDGLYPVTLRRTANGLAALGLQRETVDRALKHQLTVREAAASAGAYTTSDVAWNVPMIAMPSPPKPGDLLDEERDDDEPAVVWTILAVDRATLNTRWRLTCRDLVLHYQLDQRISIERPNLTQDDAGSRTPGYTEFVSDFVAKIQEITADVAEERGKRGLRQRYNVFLSERLVVTNDDRVRDEDGNLYEIRGYTNPDRIDELMVLECERVP